MKKGIFKALVGLLVVLMIFSLGISCSKKETAPVEKTVTETPVAKFTEESKSTTPKKVDNKTLTLAMVSTWDTFNPYESSSAYTAVINDLIFDKFVYLHTDGTYEPRLAEKVEQNDEATSITFHLRKDAKWADGEPVTAKDVIFTAQLINSPANNCQRKNIMGDIKGAGEGEDSLEVFAVDDYTVTFNLPEPTNADFLLFTQFRDFYILPEHLLGDIPRSEIRNAAFWQNPVGSGPCLFKNQISGERVEFVPNPYYYQMKGNWDKLVLRVVPTGNLLAGLMNGEIDALCGNTSSLQLSDWDMAKQQKNLVCESVPSVAYQYMAINTSQPYLTPAVRRAINMCIDRNLLVQGLLRGEGVPAWSPIPQNNIYYNPECEEPYNPEQAKEILKAEGWDPNRVLVMSVPTGNAVREQAAIIIQQNLAAIGIKAEIQSADFPTHLARVRKGDYDLGFIGSGGSPDPSECVINFSPDHINNFSHLSDYTVYKTGEKGAHVFTVEERKEAYDAYQRVIREQVPFAFLFMDNILYAHTTRVSGIDNIADSTQHNRDVWNWTINE